MGTLYAQILLVFLVLLAQYSRYATSSNSSYVGKPKTKCIEAERLALLRIKEHLYNYTADGEEILSSWGNEEGKKECCKWDGIRCDIKSGHVVELDLSPSTFGQSDRSLGGKISPSLLELQQLTYLDLSYIDFRGSQIPSSIDTLSQLRYLNLSETSFDGEIPPQFGNLSSLHVLDLTNMPIINLQWLSHLSSLRILVLSYTNLSTASDWVQRVNQLPSLTNLQLAGCDHPDICNPSSHSFINSSRSLSFLDLSYSHISLSALNSLLMNFSNSLVHLQFSSTQFEGSIPEFFDRMIAMKHLDLSDNALNGSIPEFLSNMTAMKHLDLSYNKLSGSIPKAFSRMMFLTYVDLSFNTLSGSIPEMFRNMSALEYLDLGYNKLQGQIPTSIWNCSNLRILRMVSNNISGSLPRNTFQNLKLLEILDISGNTLRGIISEAGFENLSKLHYLDLSFNSLTLDIHSDWVPPFQLAVIRLRSCNLGPLFPNWLRTQKNFYGLDISDSGISDFIPNWFWDSLYQEARYLNLSNNQIKGEIRDVPLEFLDKIPEIDLSLNQLEGPVPASFLFKVSLLSLSHNRFSKLNFRCDFMGDAKLESLDASHNQLVGELPDCFSHYSLLAVLILTDNNLSGKIPSSLGFLTSMLVLQLANNHFMGELPTTLKNCTDLNVVDVGVNNLSGLIPSWLGNSFQGLAILSLRSNHFSGSIPSSICQLSTLQLLDLSFNDITGSIPKCISNFAAMESTATIEESLGIPGYGIYHEEWDGSVHYYDVVKETVEWKGEQREFKRTLVLLKSIDLSSNKLIGEIPPETTKLTGLVSLNLSRNRLSGQIPSEIGQLTNLDALDLSWNHLRGQIPPSLARIDRLNAFDLSNNNLSGKIPTSTQLQSFPQAYMGNAELCGDPLQNKCPDEEHETVPGATSEEADHELLITRGFYISMALGFVIAFWGVCGTIIFNKSFRYAYFKLLNDAGDWVFVMAALHKARLLRMIKG